jgi:hypothetical protein
MKKLWLLFLVWILLGVCTLVIAFLVWIVTLFDFPFGPREVEKIDTATDRDVQYVLDECGLGHSRIEKVVHSYISPRSMTGDHLDAFAIKVAGIDESELSDGSKWFRCDQLQGVAKSAVAFSPGWVRDVSWFPTDLTSPDFYVRVLKFEDISMIELVFVRPSDGMVYFFSGQS